LQALDFFQKVAAVLTLIQTRNHPPFEPVLHLENHDVTRWEFASLAIMKYGLPQLTRLDKNHLASDPSALSGGMSKLNKNTSVTLVAGFCGSLYGVVHFLGWNNPASYADCVFRRTCSIITPIPLLLPFLFIFFGKLPVSTRQLVARFLDSGDPRWIESFLLLCAVLSVLCSAYIAARVF
jgi:ABC-type amino acid transport system permease subunit